MRALLRGRHLRGVGLLVVLVVVALVLVGGAGAQDIEGLVELDIDDGTAGVRDLDVESEAGSGSSPCSGVSAASMSSGVSAEISVTLPEPTSARAASAALA